MLRLFQTHQVRKQRELSGSLWDFSTLPVDGTEPVAKKAFVPGCWECDPDTVSYRGKACYERDFFAGGNIRLELKGVSHTAEVYLDGEKIASHYNAYTPFEAVAIGLPEKSHHLKVVVDNSFGEQSALHVENDYQSYGGITRGVALEGLGDMYVTYLHVTPAKKDGVWHAEIAAGIGNLTKKALQGKLRLRLEAWAAAAVGLPALSAGADRERTAGGHGEEAEIVAVVPAGEEALFCADICCPQAREWNPETPALYTVTALLCGEGGEIVDDLTERFGFRTVKVEGKRILLNGSPLRIRGFCRHEDHPQFGCALPVEAMQQDLLLMRDLGANSVRTSHYPNDERFLDLCDETGMLVWEENHARGLSEKDMRNPNFERQCEDCIREMIRAHYNHPSIYIWGILNECASHTEYGRECYASQFAQIRSLDMTRPCSFASCQFKTDICFDLPDVVSYNIYPLWYHDTPPADYLADLYGWVQRETGGAGKPFLITEVGAGGIYGYRTPAKVKWSEEYQAEALEKQLRAILSDENVSGVYIWQFCDCRVCDSWFGGRPRTMNNKGIVDEYRRPKLAYETVRKCFADA